MKKLFTISFLMLEVILISGCSLYEQKPVSNSTITEQPTVLQQMSSGSSQVETMKQEREQGTKENNELKQKISREDSAVLFSTLKNETQDASNQKQTMPQKKIYFAQGFQGKYSMVSIEDRSEKKFIPKGYEIVNQHTYDPIPKFLILKKGNNLFSYQVDNGLLNNIFQSNELFLKSNEYVSLFPSRTEKDKFFIVISKFDSKGEPGMGRLSIIAKRSYIFDALTNKVVANNNIDFNGCAEYDSKNSRFITWLCGEGIGSSAPLSIIDMNGKKQKTILSNSEFGLQEDELGIRVKYNNGLLFAEGRGNVVIIDPSQKEPTKKIYIASEEIKSTIQISSYSNAFVSSKNTFIIGGGSSIVLLYLENGKITKMKTMQDKDLYANFIFPYNDKLYYQSRNTKSLNVLDLGTWELIDQIPLEPNEEITLIEK